MKLSTIEVTGNVALGDNKSLKGDVSLGRNKNIKGNISPVVDFESASWGKITGDIQDQTDLMTILNNKARIESGQILFSIDGENYTYPIAFMFGNYVYEGVRGLVIQCDDGSIDGKLLFLPDYVGMMNAMPTALSTDDIDEVCV